MSTTTYYNTNSDGTLTAYTEDERTHSGFEHGGFEHGGFEAGVGFGLLTMLVPFETDPTMVAGRYFLARCGAQSEVERATQWGIYFRRPLFLASYRLLPSEFSSELPSQSLNNEKPTAAHDVVNNVVNNVANNAAQKLSPTPSPDSTPTSIENTKRVAECQFVLPYQPFISTELYPYNKLSINPGINPGVNSDASSADMGSKHGALSLIADPGYAWLAALGYDQPVNLMGPFGNGFELDPECRNLLLVASGGRVARLLPLIEVMLNRGGRVTIVVKAASVQEEEALRSYLLPRLPIAIELRFAHTDSGWKEQLNETLPWADQICAALPESELNGLTMRIRDRRFHLQEGFAQILVDADLICGVGACLACVVNTANGGHTRACANGPVFDLIKLSR